MGDRHELVSMSDDGPRQGGSALAPTLWACGAASQVCHHVEAVISIASSMLASLFCTYHVPTLLFFGEIFLFPVSFR